MPYRDANNTNSVLRLDSSGETAEINVSDGKCAQLDLVVTSGEGSTPLVVTLHYSDGTQTTLFSTAPDWFDDPAGLTDSSIAQGDARLYYVQNGMDRYDGFTHSYHAAGDPAIFGLRFPVNQAKTLESVSVAKDNASGSVLIVLGGTVSILPFVTETIVVAEESSPVLENDLAVSQADLIGAAMGFALMKVPAEDVATLFTAASDEAFATFKDIAPLVAPQRNSESLFDMTFGDDEESETDAVPWLTDELLESVFG